MFKSILITGASSGIGRALALQYARSGSVVGLLGRDLLRLEQVAIECRKNGADARFAAIDVCDRETLRAWIEDFNRQWPVDLLIANAGVMEGSPAPGAIEPSDKAYGLMATNVLGVLNTVQPILPGMMTLGRGRIVIMSSIAAFTPLADAPSYCASKAAVMNYGLSLRAFLAPHGVGVNVVCPGYIDTPMMRRESGPKPFVVSPEKAADLIRRGIERDKPLIVFPFLFGWVTRISGLLPDRLRRRLSQSFRFTVSPPDAG